MSSTPGVDHDQYEEHVNGQWDSPNVDVLYPTPSPAIGAQQYFGVQEPQDGFENAEFMLDPSAAYAGDAHGPGDYQNQDLDDILDSVDGDISIAPNNNNNNAMAQDPYEANVPMTRDEQTAERQSIKEAMANINDVDDALQTDKRPAQALTMVIGAFKNDDYTEAIELVARDILVNAHEAQARALTPLFVKNRHQEKYDTVANRLQAIKLSLSKSKAMVKQLLDARFIFRLCDAPRKELDIKDSNRKLNQQRNKQVKAGKEVLAKAAVVKSTLGVPGGTNPRKRKAAEAQQFSPESSNTAAQRLSQKHAREDDESEQELEGPAKHRRFSSPLCPKYLQPQPGRHLPQLFAPESSLAATQNLSRKHAREDDESEHELESSAKHRRFHTTTSNYPKYFQALGGQPLPTPSMTSSSRSSVSTPDDMSMHQFGGPSSLADTPALAATSTSMQLKSSIALPTPNLVAPDDLLSELAPSPTFYSPRSRQQAPSCSTRAQLADVDYITTAELERFITGAPDRPSPVAELSLRYRRIICKILGLQEHFAASTDLSTLRVYARGYNGNLVAEKWYSADMSKEYHFAIGSLMTPFDPSVNAAHFAVVMGGRYLQLAIARGDIFVLANGVKQAAPDILFREPLDEEAERALGMIPNAFGQMEGLKADAVDPRRPHTQ